MSFSSCKEAEQVRVYAPDGAPALALAKLLHEDTDDDGVTYTITSANKIQAFVGGADSAEVCILPINQASNLLGDGATYQMVGLATHGNMYLLSEQNTWISPENVGQLTGKRLGVVQLPNVPGLALRAALSLRGVAYSTTTVTMDGVYLQGIAPTEVKAQGDYDYYLCPEPAASAKIKAFTAQGKPLYMVGDLQAFYGEEGYPQACVVAKKSFIQSSPKKLKEILDGLTGVSTYLQSAEIAEICSAVSSHLEEGLSATFSVQNLSREVLSRCGVRFEKSESCRQRVDEFLQKIKAISADSASVVSDNFYYIEG